MISLKKVKDSISKNTKAAEDSINAKKLGATFYAGDWALVLQDHDCIDNTVHQIIDIDDDAHVILETYKLNPDGTVTHSPYHSIRLTIYALQKVNKPSWVK